MLVESLPAAPDIERAVLGAVLLDPSVGPAVAEAGEEIFSVPAHRFMAKAIAELTQEGVLADQLTLAERLRRNNALEAVGGEDRIHALLPGIDSTPNLMGHLEILREKAIRRKLALLGASLARQAQDDTADPRKYLCEHEAALGEVTSRLEKKNWGLSEQVRDWVMSTHGNFLSTDVHKNLDLSTRVHKKYASTILGRLVEEGIIERVPDRRGSFRRVLNDCPPVDFRGPRVEPLDLRFPLGEHELVKIGPKSIIVVAGVSNAGKTAWLINFVRRNMDRFPIRYFSSEMGPEEFQDRLLRHHDLSLAQWTVRFHERSAEFQDVIRPDEINIIDFLEIHTDFFLVGEHILRIFEKLRSGVAVIALQKNRDRETGLGGERSLEKARLYIALDPAARGWSKATIIKAKNPRNPDLNPNRLSRRFTMRDGGLIVPDPGGWNEEDWKGK